MDNNKEDILITIMHDVITYAKESVDPSTQNAAFLIDDNYNIIDRQVNKIPPGTYYREDQWERPKKYYLIEHAERYVIFNTAYKGISTKDLIMVCPFCACADCARAIVLSGIKRVVRLKNNIIHPRWVESVNIGDEIMKENGVEIQELDCNFNIQIRRNGKFIVI